MKKTNIKAFLPFIILILAGCKNPNLKVPNKPIKEQQENIKIERIPFETYDCPYNQFDLLAIINENHEKESWPKIRVTATFGGLVFLENNPCVGCENCGCCFGLCIEIESKSKMVYVPLTNTQLAQKEILFDFIDRPNNNEIILIPNSNIDNGDGYLHNSGDSKFGVDVCNYIGRQIQLKKGSYEIVYSNQFPFGVIVVTTL